MTKRLMGLKKLDNFAEPITLTFNGSKWHSTRAGGCLTVLLFLTVMAYWVWGTLNCFEYYKPQVFTANVPLTENPHDLNFTWGGRM